MATDPVDDALGVASIVVDVAEVVRSVLVAEQVRSLEPLDGLRVVVFDLERVPAECIDCSRVIQRRCTLQLLQR